VQTDLGRRLFAEALGTAIVVAAVIGSGIMAATLSPAAPAVALLANTLATVAVLFVLIASLAPISGAHFNPAVSLVMALRGALSWDRALAYVAAQCAGALLGMALAHAMFDLPLIQASTTIRTGAGQWLAEGVATAGLVAIILLAAEATTAGVAARVAAWIAGAYWFTASTSFANPAVTLGRALTDTFAGISPPDVPAFIAAQLAGALLGLGIARLLRKPE
jgi:glycerol uptake facilitator-like aquaporin